MPSIPDLERLRTLARQLQRGVRDGNADALALAARYGFDPAAFRLSTAQLIVARECGSSSWPALRRHLDVVADRRRDPDRATVQDDPADEFVRLACLVYSEVDGPERWAAAGALREADPSLTGRSVYAAAAAADVGALRAQLAGATTEGGPYGWPPLLYLTYSRVPAATEDVLASARLLLDAGADPDAGYLWHGYAPPFTALTGVFGEGEQGAGKQPPHPAGEPLARLLLDAGADPSDAQSLYNRMFRPDDGHLRLLFAYGLGRDDAVWRDRLGDATESPAEMLSRQLNWAAEHGFTERVRLLLAHGVAVDGTHPDGRPPVELAAAEGHRDIVTLLVAAGAPEPAASPVDDLVAAILAGDPVDPAPAVLAAARRERPELVRTAVAGRRADAVETAVRLGFPVDGDGRRTPLHEAAWSGDLAMVRRLVALGADLAARDPDHDGTPLDWARYAHQDEVAAYLGSLPSKSIG